MKKILITLLAIIPLIGMAQISGQMRIGVNADYRQPIISPALDFAAYGLHINTEMIVNPANDKPASFGAKFSYELKLNDKWAFQAGAGRYFNIYSLDAYDKNRNGWSNLFFMAAHWDKWFVEYDYLNGSILSIGFRETLSNLK